VIKIKIVWASILFAILATFAYPLFSIHMRTKKAYLFVCEIVPRHIDLPSVERWFGKKPKEIYPKGTQAPDWIQTLLVEAILTEQPYSIHYFVYEGMPSFLFLLVCEGTSNVPSTAIIWDGKHKRIIKSEGQDNFFGD